MNTLTSATTIPGFVWAYRLRPGSSKPERLPDDTDRSTLFGEEGFLWLHLNLVDARVPAFLEDAPGLNEAARIALTTHESHATLTVDDQMLFGTLVDFQRDFAQDTRDIGWLHFVVTDRMLITSRLQPLRSLDRARVLIEKNASRFSRPLDIFELLVVEFQRTLISVVIEISEELNLIEDFVHGNTSRDERTRLPSVRRTIVRLHRHLRTVLSLMRHAAASDDEEMPLGFEDVAGRLTGRLEAVDHDVFALQERARLLHEEIGAKLSSEINRHLYILSIMTAFLLPPTLVTGFFGMNTSGLPLAGGASGTGYAVGFIVASMLLAWWLLKRVNIL
ncbi:Magnesium and cobalt transporter protein [Rhizobium freirei PRF 81]|uniref:Magnesium and cobalt transporter protein n=1 Tax=Rhizobium freirei PRF 81 TaxID=363754 RepID=N6VDB3_9HYPH|nr:transporter [Rhizobium freirei]ENN89032.1 Magnesium and cobalt transporter protein [Rhizobium freirei PRF 81]